MLYLQGPKHNLPSRVTRGYVRRSSGATLTAGEPGCAEQLARFFPSTKAIRIPVQVTVARAGGSLREATVLEFGGLEHAIFLSALPLEFDDRVTLAREGKSSDAAEGTVVAAQYHEGRKAIAVRLSQNSCHWVTQP